MEEILILHVETATPVCSVALSQGKNLLAIRESDEDKSHSSLLTVFMNEVLHEAGINASDLHALAISKGPGSYTGLRIGVSAVKGFAYALKLPVIGVNTLFALASGALSHPQTKALAENNSDLLLCPMIDARRMEVYAAFYTQKLDVFRKVSADIIDENSYADLLAERPVLAFGNGCEKIRDTLKHENLHFLDKIVPSAKNLIPAALEAYKVRNFENTAYFEPFYLKDFIATTPKKKVL